ncbi:MAG: hypothetical protein QM760_08150 [Nibricoccus sp.]
MNPPAQSLPYERAVICHCDRTFHLPLALLISPDSEPAHACVRCGHISCTEVLWTHVHHNTFEPHGRREFPVSEETLAWLDLWPRVLRGNDFEDYAFLPSIVRCTDITDFQLQAARAFASSRTWPRGRRLREAGIPSVPPPASLPKQLENYQTLWELSHELTPDREIAFLLRNARPAYRLSSPLALDALLQRSDLPEVFAEASASQSYEDSEIVCALVRENPVTLPLALPGLLAWLDQAVGRPAPFSTVTACTHCSISSPHKRARPSGSFQCSKQSSPASAATRTEFPQTHRDHPYAERRAAAPISQTPWFFNSFSSYLLHRHASRPHLHPRPRAHWALVASSPDVVCRRGQPPTPAITSCAR